MKKRGTLIVTAIICTVALLLAACGNNATSGSPQKDDSTEATTTQAETTLTQPAGTEITEAEAKEIALKDAGLAEADVTFTKIGRDSDDGIEKYEIEFYSGQTEYDYDIECSTGRIISKSTETNQNLPQQNPGAGNAAITEQQALDAALQHAGVSAADISQSKIKLEYDDDYGKQVYDIEFHVGMTEYSYDIDPDSGAVLKYDRDMDE